ncbi:hypothetical protein TYRP_020401 [Tyrophagus putrescentiae]|nr:hypothetical protein TYRP_020401 [Tyrophagus putrescentiae]
MPWRTVPDLCIIAVLKQMPLIDQLTAGNISPRWNILLRAANRRVRYLAIFCGDSINQEYVSPFSIDSRSLSLRMLTDDNGKTLYPVTRLTKWNCLLIKSWKNAEGQSLITVGQIANAFSAITELNFDTGRLDDYQHLVDMLEHPNWKHQLNSFSLNDHYKSSNNKPALSPTLNKHLFVAINGLSSLRHLAINWINASTISPFESDN